MKKELTSQQLNDTFAEIFKQSDRASAVVSGGILEEILERMIISYLLPLPNIKKLLFDGMSPLSTFGAKIYVAFYLGLINKAEYDDLVLIKKIRNEFAHSIERLNFETPKIKDRCLQLQTLNNTKPPKEMFDNMDKVRVLFQTNITLLASILFDNIKRIKHLEEYEYIKS